MVCNVCPDFHEDAREDPEDNFDLAEGCLDADDVCSAFFNTCLNRLVGFADHLCVLSDTRVDAVAEFCELRAQPR